MYSHPISSILLSSDQTSFDLSHPFHIHFNLTNLHFINNSYLLYFACSSLLFYSKYLFYLYSISPSLFPPPLISTPTTHIIPKVVIQNSMFPVALLSVVSVRKVQLFQNEVKVEQQKATTPTSAT